MVSCSHNQVAINIYSSRTNIILLYDATFIPSLLQLYINYQDVSNASVGFCGKVEINPPLPRIHVHSGHGQTPMYGLTGYYFPVLATWTGTTT